MSRVEPHPTSPQVIEDEIYKRLTSKKFRKWSLDDTTKSRTRAAIHECVESNKPIQIVYPFGGYKLWQLYSSPKADWAEFFSIIYYAEYLVPLTNIYTPGVELVFSSDSFILERMNNVAGENTELYHKSFVELIKLIQKYLPSNLSMKVFKTKDLYSNTAVLEAELLTGLDRATNYYRNLSSEELKHDIEVAEKNIQWKGAQDLTKMSETERKEFTMQSLIYHGSYTHLAKRIEYNRGSDKIVISALPSNIAIPIGTTKRSVVKFWIGTGILKLDTNDNTLSPRVVSPLQLEELNGKKVNTSHTLIAKNLANNNFNYIYQA